MAGGGRHYRHQRPSVQQKDEAGDQPMRLRWGLTPSAHPQRSHRDPYLIRAHDYLIRELDRIGPISTPMPVLAIERDAPCSRLSLVANLRLHACTTTRPSRAGRPAGRSPTPASRPRTRPSATVRNTARPNPLPAVLRVSVRMVGSRATAAVDSAPAPAVRVSTIAAHWLLFV